jgi:DNA-binding response OmpR family regulator
MNTALPENVARARAGGIPLALKSFTALAFDGNKVIVRWELPPDSERIKPRTILLVSQDAAFAGSLCLPAARNSFAVVRTSSFREAIEQLNRVKPAAVLLDLDLSSDVGWQAAEWFLGHEPGVPILMITGCTDQSELGAAIRSGTVFEKTHEPARLLHAVESMLEESATQGQERIARQQAWLRRAKPYRWEDAAALPYRYWGINE